MGDVIIVALLQKITLSQLFCGKKTLILSSLYIFLPYSGNITLSSLEKLFPPHFNQILFPGTGMRKLVNHRASSLAIVIGPRVKHMTQHKPIILLPSDFLNGTGSKDPSPLHWWSWEDKSRTITKLLHLYQTITHPICFAYVNQLMSHLPKLIRICHLKPKESWPLQLFWSHYYTWIHLSYQVLATGHRSRNGKAAKCWPPTTWKDRPQHCTKDISFSMFLFKGEFCFSWDSNHEIILPAQRNRL